MLSKLINVFSGPSVNAKKKSYLVAQSSDLLLTDHRLSDVTKIKRLLSVTNETWEAHYLYAINAFCEIVQELPASEYHHHSYSGGLIDHTLNVLLTAMKVSQGYVLPPDSEPEDVAGGAERWRYGVFIAALSHDLGKVITDIEVVYSEKGEPFTAWYPWISNIPFGAEYVYRYKKKAQNSTIARTLHEQVAVSLVPRLITREAIAWINADVELMAQLYTTISNSPFGGGVVREIVKTADKNSVSTNLVTPDPTSNQPPISTGTSSLSDKLILTLRQLANTGVFKKNKPGAAIWVTDKYTWAVSKAVMESVRDSLIADGHKGIPNNPVTLFSILSENGLVIKNSEDSSVWYAEVTDPVNSWVQKLTFLKFDNEIIWPKGVTNVFAGTVIPVNDSDKDMEDEPTEKGREEVKDSSPAEASPANVSKVKDSKEEESNKIRTKQKNDHVYDVKNAISDTGEGSIKKPEIKAGNANKVLDHSFFAWLNKNIKRHRIRVNEPGAMVHFTDEYMLIVSPRIFQNYLKESSLRMKEYTVKGKKPFEVLQREVEAMKLHKKPQSGSNMCLVTIKGERNIAQISCYCLERKHFPMFKKFSANSALELSW